MFEEEIPESMIPLSFDEDVILEKNSTNDASLMVGILYFGLDS